MTNRLSNRCLTEQTVELIDSFTDANDTLNQCGKWKRLDDHSSLECRYNPFRLVNVSDDDKSKLSSFFTSIRDKFRYQASDRSDTFMSDTKHCFTKLLYDGGDQYHGRHLIRFARDMAVYRQPLWREQFDHASKDFLSSLGFNGYDHVVERLAGDELNDLQKWWDLFGRYWLCVNRHNDQDTKLIGWLKNGAGHGTVDVCGENLGVFEPVYDRVRGSRLLLSGAIDNKSKFLKAELGHQV